MAARNRKGFEASMAFLIDAILLGMMLVGSYLAVSGSLTANLAAETDARNLGAAIDVAGLSRADVTITDTCPRGDVFTIEDNRVTVKSNKLFGEGAFTYHFLVPKNRVAEPKNIVDCSVWDKIAIVKSSTPTGEIRILVGGLP